MISEATAKTHVARILQKLGLRDRVQAVIYAYETGLVAPGSPHYGRAGQQDSDLPPPGYKGSLASNPGGRET